MKEPMSNIGYVCPEHSPKPGKYTNDNPVNFLDRHVKVAFLSPDSRRVEHMWVKILFIDHKNDTLFGTLDNDPIYATQYKCGDRVKVQLWEIEQVL